MHVFVEAFSLAMATKAEQHSCVDLFVPLVPSCLNPHHGLLVHNPIWNQSVHTPGGCKVGSSPLLYVGL